MRIKINKPPRISQGDLDKDIAKVDKNLGRNQDAKDNEDDVFEEQWNSIIISDEDMQKKVDAFSKEFGREPTDDEKLSLEAQLKFKVLKEQNEASKENDVKEAEAEKDNLNNLYKKPEALVMSQAQRELAKKQIQEDMQRVKEARGGVAGGSDKPEASKEASVAQGQTGFEKPLNKEELEAMADTIKEVRGILSTDDSVKKLEKKLRKDPELAEKMQEILDNIYNIPFEDKLRLFSNKTEDYDEDQKLADDNLAIIRVSLMRSKRGIKERVADFFGI